MNVTIAVDDELLRRSRVAAQERGLSLQEYLRGCLRALAGERPTREVADELMDLLTEHVGRSGGRRIGRDAAYEDRT